LIQSELFGHRRGSFTGAVEARRGAFELADGGTLFLDEIGELSESAQPVLLRALQERTIVPVGDTVPKPVSVRVVAATNRRLHQDALDGKFREDLFYRLNGVSLELPPLRERSEDIPLLARHFAVRGQVPELTPAVLGALAMHSWPGNVRELEQAVSAYGVLEMLPNVARPAGAARPSTKAIDIERPYEDLKRELLEQFQSNYLKSLLSHTGGNISAAARLSGLERSYLGKLLRRSA
jgi:transcriptional regulator with GAF, ATPase, and Fis domain